MSKKDKNNSNNKVESNGKVTEAVEVLRVQLQEHLQKSEYHKTMATKAQGALEVLLQLHPEENQNVVVDEVKDNHQEASVAN
jgi:hypothetical protein|tara:strand:- start:402 stop:647 length:246 start_codon:yes stop_codon:yes gene_type:complete